MDEETGASGSGTIAIDAGTPFEHGDDAPEPKPAAESQEAKDLKALRVEVANLTKRANEAEEDSRYWSRRAQEQRATTARTDDEPAPRRREAVAQPVEKPEKLIDELSTEGLSALQKRGIITRETLDEVLDEHNKAIDTKITTAWSDAEFGMRLAREYPEIAADSERVDKGERPQTELFKRTGELYREAVATDPSLKGSQGLLLIVAKQAKAELDLKAKADKKPPKEDEEETTLPHQERTRRRDRIDAQRPERGRNEEETRGDPGFDRDQLQVMKHLGVKPDEFKKHTTAAGGRRNGR